MFFKIKQVQATRAKDMEKIEKCVDDLQECLKKMILLTTEFLRAEQCRQVPPQTAALEIFFLDETPCINLPAGQNEKYWFLTIG